MKLSAEDKAIARELRVAALTAASRSGAKDPEKVLRDADSYFRWLIGTDTATVIESRLNPEEEFGL